MSQPLSEYLRNKEMIRSTPWRYIGETEQSGYLLESGVLISDEGIKELYPISDRVILWNHKYKGDNPDKTHVK